MEALPVTRVTPVRGGPLEMSLLVDNCSHCEPGISFDDLPKLISSQPASTAQPSGLPRSQP